MRDYPNTVPAIYARLDRLRHKALREPSAALADESDELAAGLEGRGGSWLPIALQSRTVNLEIRFRAWDRIQREMIAATHTSRLLGIDEAMVAERAAIAVQLSETLKKWYSDFEAVFQLANKLKSKLVLGEAIYSHSACIIEHEAVSRKLVEPSADLDVGRNKLLTGVVARLELAAKHFEAEGADELRLQTLLLRADALWLLGRSIEARALAQSVADSALTWSLPAIRERALRVSAGESPFKEIDSLPAIFEV